MMPASKISIHFNGRRPGQSYCTIYIAETQIAPERTQRPCRRAAPSRRRRRRLPFFSYFTDSFCCSLQLTGSKLSLPSQQLRDIKTTDRVPSRTVLQVGRYACETCLCLSRKRVKWIDEQSQLDSWFHIERWLVDCARFDQKIINKLTRWSLHQLGSWIGMTDNMGEMRWIDARHCGPSII